MNNHSHLPSFIHWSVKGGFSMPKYPCYSNNSCIDPCASKGFFLQQIYGQGQMVKHGCPYTIYTECGTAYPNTNAIRYLETFGEPVCALLPDCGRNGLSVRVKIPVLLHLCSCNCESTEKGYIEEVVSLKFCGCKDNLWRCKILANACVKLKENNCCCVNPSSLSLDVHIQVFLLCGCIIQPAHTCCCPEQKSWYPQPVSCNRL